MATSRTVKMSIFLKKRKVAEDPEFGIQIWSDPLNFVTKKRPLKNRGSGSFILKTYNLFAKYGLVYSKIGLIQIVDLDPFSSNV